MRLSSTRYANGWPHLQPRGTLFSLQWFFFYSSFCALHKRLVSYCCQGQFANANRRYTVMNVGPPTFLEQVIASILRQSLWDDIAFRTVPPIGGPSCLNFDNWQPEVVSDVISGVVIDPAGVKVRVKLGDSM